MRDETKDITRAGKTTDHLKIIPAAASFPFLTVTVKQFIITVKITNNRTRQSKYDKISHESSIILRNFENLYN